MDYRKKGLPLHSNNEAICLKNGLAVRSTIKMLDGSSSKLDILQNRRNLDFTMLMKKYKRKKEASQQPLKSEKAKRYSPNGYIINNYLSGKYPNKLKAMMNMKES